jgi:hypothetical protein
LTQLLIKIGLPATPSQATHKPAPRAATRDSGGSPVLTTFVVLGVAFATTVLILVARRRMHRPAAVI